MSIVTLITCLVLVYSIHVCLVCLFSLKCNLKKSLTQRINLNVCRIGAFNERAKEMHPDSLEAEEERNLRNYQQEPQKI